MPNTEARGRWKVAGGGENRLDLAWLGDLAPFGAQLLAGRGISTGEQMHQFLDPAPRNLAAPQLLRKELDTAVACLIEAVRSRHKVGIYGDFDADGLSASAIIADLVKLMGGQYEVYIPDRELEGHGISREGIEALLQTGVRLIITVDTGISAYEELEFARRNGVSVIVTDHHRPNTERSVPANAVLNGQSMGASNVLCGAGVAFIFARATLEELHLSMPRHWWGVACLGTVADLVPLAGDSRVIAYMGLEELNRTGHAGLQALVNLTRFSNRNASVVADTISYQLAPRLNAPSRLGDAGPSFHLLTTTNVADAAKFASQLEALNGKRKRLTTKMEALAESQMASQKYANITVCQVPLEFAGMTGLLAGRLVRSHEKPAVVLVQPDKASMRASVRSGGALDIHSALVEAKEQLMRFGGHPGAGGFTVAVPQLDAILEHLNECAIKQGNGNGDPEKPEWEVDYELPLAALTHSHWNFVSLMEPFGCGNPVPRLLARNVRLSNVSKSRWPARYEGEVMDGNASHRAVWHGGSDSTDDPDARYDIVYHPELEKRRGNLRHVVKVDQLFKLE